jgi:hypothetical protein
MSGLFRTLQKVLDASPSPSRREARALFRFLKEQDLKQWLVTSDKEQFGGFSTAR